MPTRPVPAVPKGVGGHASSMEDVATRFGWAERLKLWKEMPVPRVLAGEILVTGWCMQKGKV